jgi:hypothetical protein
MEQTFDIVHFTPDESQYDKLQDLFLLIDEGAPIRYHKPLFQIVDGVISIDGLGQLNHSSNIAEPLATECKQITIRRTLSGVFWITVQST